MEKLGIMAQGLADKNIITMLLIFLTAGVFVGVVGRSSAESVAYFMLSIIPTRFSVAVLFGVACFVSCHGNISRNDHLADTNCGSGISCFRLWSSALCGVGHWRIHVW